MRNAVFMKIVMNVGCEPIYSGNMGCGNYLLDFVNRVALALEAQ